jgi:hypothetical protein
MMQEASVGMLNVGHTSCPGCAIAGRDAATDQSQLHVVSSSWIAQGTSNTHTAEPPLHTNRRDMPKAVEHLEKANGHQGQARKWITPEEEEAIPHAPLCVP